MAVEAIEDAVRRGMISPQEGMARAQAAGYGTQTNIARLQDLARGAAAMRSAAPVGGGGAAPAQGPDRARVLMDVIAGRVKGMQAESMLNRVGVPTSLGTSYPMTALESAIAGGQRFGPAPAQPSPLSQFTSADALLIGLMQPGTIAPSDTSRAQQAILQGIQNQSGRIPPVLVDAIRGM